MGKPTIERYLEIVPAQGRKAKLTINPNTGRVTVKVPQTSTQQEADVLKALGEKALTYELPLNKTFRGVIHRIPNSSDYNCILQNDCKSISCYITYKAETK